MAEIDSPERRLEQVKAMHSLQRFVDDNDVIGSYRMSPVEFLALIDLFDFETNPEIRRYIREANGMILSASEIRGMQSPLGLRGLLRRHVSAAWRSIEMTEELVVPQTEEETALREADEFWFGSGLGRSED